MFKYLKKWFLILKENTLKVDCAEVDVYLYAQKEIHIDAREQFSFFFKNRIFHCFIWRLGHALLLDRRSLTTKLTQMSYIQQR